MGTLVNRTKNLFKRTNKKKTALASAEPPAQVVIVGAGIVGLVLALALHEHCGISPEIYEKANAFHDDVGAGMGMYPNGLRVIRDISPKLLEQIQQTGCPYLVRRWERHDGTEIAVADESILTSKYDNLQSIGIRRWQLQKLLFQAVQDAGMKVHFGKRLEGIKQVDDDDQTTTLRFADGTTRTTQLLLAVDGSRSKVRKILLGGKCNLKYMGVTCLMGTASVARADQGISLPSAETTKCHGAFYPTSPTEQCFQFHFPVDEEQAQGALGSWGNLTEHVGQEECDKLVERLQRDGWDEKYLQPLHHVDKAIRIGLSTLDPPLETFVYGRVALLGDAAHPPVPYLGQGAQQGLEDAGTLALLLGEIGTIDDDSGRPTLSLSHLDTVLRIYNCLRLPRTKEILKHGKEWGSMQQKRAENKRFNHVKEEKIRREVFYHETLPVLFTGVNHDYKEEVTKALKEEPLLSVPEEESIR